MERIAIELLKVSVTLLPVMMLAVLAVCTAAAIVYFRYRPGPEGSRRSGFAFVWRVLAAGVAGGCLGAAGGIAFVCSYTASNLCGLAGVFVTGPLGLVLGVIVYLYAWVARGRRV